MKLGFALVGCGRIAKKHAEILGGGQLPQGRLTAVCDIQLERARAYGEKYGVPYFSDMHQMMAAKGADIDVVNILTPSGLHALHCIDLSRYGKHIVVEKPMALSLPDADAMIRACDAARIRLFVVNQNRFNPPIARLRVALESGRFGKLVLGTVRVRWSRTQEYYDQDAWRGTWALDGGVIANQASHHIDLLEWMMGDVESVFAKSATALVNIEAEDTAVVIVKFVNGALGIIEATTATRPRDLEGSISILGEKGSVEVGGFAVNETKVWAFTEPHKEDAMASSKCKDAMASSCNDMQPPNVYGFGHLAYLQNVIDCIENKTAALVDGLEGRKSLELITAIYESIETKKEVFLRFRHARLKLGK